MDEEGFFSGRKGRLEMTAPKRILELVELFGRNIDSYKSGKYNETQVRREFIDPFFMELGWDVDNRKGYAEAYKDVIHEDAIKVGSATKAPDYCFRIGGTRKFFLEAKNPSVNLKDAPSPAYQLRRYAWSAKLPLSILTDFEEFAVYDCRVKPGRTDKASAARVMYLNYTEYPDKWEQIASIFAREAVLKGSFDKYAETAKRKKGTAEVDEAFLNEIEQWRDGLARNIALRNPKLTNRQLNYAVQKTIDRIIFLRICEDRGIERYGELQGLLNGAKVYDRLLVLFRHADDRYNSGLFHFTKEKDRAEGPDELTPGLAIDDKVLKDIFRRLYYPESPYEFSVLPAEILGHVYEQFLGKVITLSSGHRAKIEEKPEVKKAGGVYYTPSYIVDYIVDNTVGKLVEGKTPKQVEKLKILDPACGSGSFLLGAYQYLLDWHLKYYMDNETEKWLAKKNPPMAETDGSDKTKGGYKLTGAERKRILLNNIYGVDIDTQAVEVTKLSLLLKVLEGERQLVLFHKERALPDLGENIKCGNSLIGTDFYKGQQMGLFDEEQQLKINAFDWEKEFQGIFSGKNPGFDAVIGNPPYGAHIDKTQADYLKNKYTCTTNTLDTYAIFIEQSSRLLNESGLFGMIVQSGWVSSPTMEDLRKLFIKQFIPLSFVTLPYDVFSAYIDTIIVIARKNHDAYNSRTIDKQPVELIVFPPKYKIYDIDEFKQFIKFTDATKWRESKNIEFAVTLSDLEYNIIQNLEKKELRFSDILDIQRGVTPFKLSNIPLKINNAKAFSGTVRRYKIIPGEVAYIQYDETLAEYKPDRYFKGPRLLLRELISRQFQLQAIYVEEEFVTNKSMQSLLAKNPSYNILYSLGLLNSKLLSWYFLAIHSVGRRDDFPKIVLKQTRELPYASINITDKKEKAQHDKLVSLVETMLDLNKRLQSAKTPDEQRVLERQIEGTDREIDGLVYDLYGLTPEEIKIVEDAAK